MRPGGGSVPPRSPDILGRERDLDEIMSLLGKTGGGGALLLSGEAGIGKTAVLDAVEARMTAEGSRVLRAAGAEFEAEVSFSGLNQVLFSLHEVFDQLDDPHGQALRVALGFGSGPVPDKLVVSNATLVLLQRVAADRPLLVVVDDVPWMDRASTAVLGFVARRLTGGRVSLLVAARTGTESFFERSGLPEYELLPLDAESAGMLVDSRFPGLAGRVRRRLLSTAQGNPLALLELPKALNKSQQKASENLPEVLPLSQRLEGLFAARITALPEATRRLLLLAALDGTGDLGVLQAAARQEGEAPDLDALSPAEHDQLVQVDENTRRLSFRHPLIRSAAVQITSSSGRRSAHRTLAEVLVDWPERRAWHLGEASFEPDEQVALLLEEAAHLVLQRGDAMSAVRALTRAADLSPQAADRSRRLGEAAYIGAEAGGALKTASELLESARRADSSASLHSAAAAAQLILNGDGDVTTAHRLLVAAIEEGAHRYDGRDRSLVDALHLLLLLAHYGGQADLYRPLYTALGRLRPGAPANLEIAAASFSDPARMDRALLRKLDHVLDDVRAETDPASIVRAGTAAMYPERLDEMREASWRVVRQGRDGGPARRHIGALFHLCVDDYLAGRWSEAATLADEGLRLCEETGYAFFLWYFQAQQAQIAAARGDTESVRTLTDGITRWAMPRGVRTAVYYANHARGLAAIGSGDFESAYRHASAISPLGSLASHVPHALWVMLDAVEAAMRTGRAEEAAAHVRAVRDAGVASVAPRLALLADAAAGLSAPDDDASVALFEEALSAPGLERWPFDLARVRLMYGERLRRVRAGTQARTVLTSALDAFENLGAQPWVDRTAKELRATGWASPRARRSTPDRPALTPQEREIARLAASGLTNRQIAERLFLSHRTVGAHLYQIFPKLGITSRGMLRDALASLDDGEDAGTS